MRISETDRITGSLTSSNPIIPPQLPINQQPITIGQKILRVNIYLYIYFLWYIIILNNKSTPPFCFFIASSVGPLCIHPRSRDTLHWNQLRRFFFSVSLFFSELTASRQNRFSPLKKEKKNQIKRSHRISCVNVNKCFLLSLSSWAPPTTNVIQTPPFRWVKLTFIELAHWNSHFQQSSFFKSFKFAFYKSISG